MKNNNSKNENFKNAICYIPFVAIVLFFTENNKTTELKKHIKYGFFLFLTFIVIKFLLSILAINVGGILSFVYILITGFFGYKVYTGEKVDIEYIDKFEEEFNKKMK